MKVILPTIIAIYFVLRYHEKCLQLFENPKEIKSAQRDEPIRSPEEFAVRYVARSIRNVPEKNWTSIELHDLYKSKGGAETNRYRFINSIITEHMKNELCVFTSAGVASIIMLKDKASSMFKMVSENDEDDDISIKRVAKKIKSELNNLPHNNSEYDTLGAESLFDECSSTLLTLLSTITSRFHNSLAAAMVGNIVKGIVTKRHTKLQLSLGILVREKKLIEHLHEYGITSTYQEVRRFKISAAVAGENQTTDAKLNSTDGLIQAISDNFDAHIHSQNGLKETHVLATIITQPVTSIKVAHRNPIPRLKQEQLKSVKLQDAELKFFTGQKNPPMPRAFSYFGVLPLKVLCHQVVSQSCKKQM